MHNDEHKALHVAGVSMTAGITTLEFDLHQPSEMPYGPRCSRPPDVPPLRG